MLSDVFVLYYLYTNTFKKRLKSVLFDRTYLQSCSTQVRSIFARLGHGLYLKGLGLALALAVILDFRNFKFLTVGTRPLLPLDLDLDSNLAVFAGSNIRH